MSTQLDPQGKKLRAKQAFDKGTVQLKYKGNQKQIKLNEEIDNILDQIQASMSDIEEDPKIADTRR